MQRSFTYRVLQWQYQYAPSHADNPPTFHDQSIQVIPSDDNRSVVCALFCPIQVNTENWQLSGLLDMQFTFAQLSDTSRETVSHILQSQQAFMEAALTATVNQLIQNFLVHTPETQTPWVEFSKFDLFQAA